MYVAVIPAVKLPRHLASLIYRVPPSLIPKIQKGAFVMVPFRKKLLIGVIDEVLSENQIQAEKRFSPTDIFSLRDVFTAVLPPAQHKLIHWVARQYFTSPALILKSMASFYTPAMFSNKERVLQGESSTPRLKRQTQKPSHTLLQRILKTPAQNFFFHAASQETTVAFYQTLLRDFPANPSGQVLFLFPTARYLFSFAKILLPHLRDFVLIIHSGLTPKARREAGRDLWTRAPKIILGTRLALWAPFRTLSMVVITHEHSPHHQQWDMAPKIHAREVAFELTKLHSTPFILTSPFPSAEIFLKIKQHEISFIPGTNPRVPSQSLQTRVIDLLEERKKKNFSWFSEILWESLQANLAERKQTILFVKKKGLASRVQCRACDFVISCPVCQNPLRMEEKSRPCLICKICSTEASLPVECPVCHGHAFREKGLGIQKVEKILKKNMPSITIINIEAKKKIDPSQVAQADVLIGTEALLLQTHWKNAKTIAFLLIDSEWAIPHFRSMERLLQLLWEVKLKIQTESSGNVNLFLQTFQKDHPIFQHLRDGDIETFYAREFFLRQKFGYPPFQRLIQYTMDPSKLKQNKSEIKIFLSRVTELANKNPKTFQFSGPFQKDGTRSDTASTWLFRIDPSDPAILFEIARVLPKDGFIHPDPLNLP